MLTVARAAGISYEKFKKNKFQILSDSIYIMKQLWVAEETDNPRRISSKQSGKGYDIWQQQMSELTLAQQASLVYVRGKGVVLKEPSVVAYDRDTNKIKAIGEEARLHARAYARKYHGRCIRCGRA